MRLKLIGCEVLYRELCAAVSRSVNCVDLEFLPQGLHERGGAHMRSELQRAVDRAEDGAYQAVLLGYALCGNGLVGLRARSAPLVAPRAHDCITLLLGGNERYLDYFRTHPGVLFRSAGWVERIGAGGRQLGLGYEDLLARYGEENAGFLFRELAKNYRQITFIETGLEAGEDCEQRALEEAAQRGRAFEKLPGDLGLIQRLADGPWRESEFLVVPPGRQVGAAYGEEILKTEAV